MYVGRYRPGVPASGTRDRRLRGYLVSFARCLRVETDLAAAVLPSVLNLDQSIFYIFSPVMSVEGDERVSGLVGMVSDVVGEALAAAHRSYASERTCSGLVGGAEERR